MNKRANHVGSVFFRCAPWVWKCLRLVRLIMLVPPPPRFPAPPSHRRPPAPSPPHVRRMAGLAASNATGSSSASRSDERQSNGSNDGASGEYHDAAGCLSDAAMVLHLDPDELAEEAADSMREKLQLTAEEWNEWEELKEGCLTTAASAATPLHAPTRPPSVAGWRRGAIGSASCLSSASRSGRFGPWRAC